MNKILMRKNRKPRTKSIKMCSCMSLNCDPFIVNIKLNKRINNGLCPGCGHKICSCKRKDK